jgi:regulator of RNase E activity RraA
MSGEAFDGAAWADVPSAAASDAVGRVGAMDSSIRRLCGRRVVGPAYTVVTGTGDSSTIHRALMAVPAGSVVVVDAQGATARSVWGGVLTAAAMAAGAVGAVVDGVVRDLDEVAAQGFTLFARGTCPAGPHKGFRGSHGVPVQCGGVVVHPGDIVVGDADGVSVVPAAQATAALAAVERIAATERSWLERIRGGESSAEILGFQ